MDRGLLVKRRTGPTSFVYRASDGLLALTQPAAGTAAGGGTSAAAPLPPPPPPLQPLLQLPLPPLPPLPTVPGTAAGTVPADTTLERPPAGSGGTAGEQQLPPPVRGAPLPADGGEGAMAAWQRQAHQQAEAWAAELASLPLEPEPWLGDLGMQPLVPAVVAAAPAQPSVLAAVHARDARQPAQAAKPEGESMQQCWSCDDGSGTTLLAVQQQHPQQQPQPQPQPPLSPQPPPQQRQQSSLPGEQQQQQPSGHAASEGAQQASGALGLAASSSAEPSTVPASKRPASDARESLAAEVSVELGKQPPGPSPAAAEEQLPARSPAAAEDQLPPPSRGEAEEQPPLVSPAEMAKRRRLNSGGVAPGTSSAGEPGASGASSAPPASARQQPGAPVAEALQRYRGLRYRADGSGYHLPWWVGA